jgi:hypothetical protein
MGEQITAEEGGGLLLVDYASVQAVRGRRHSAAGESVDILAEAVVGAVSRPTLADFRRFARDGASAHPA